VPAALGQSVGQGTPERRPDFNYRAFILRLFAVFEANPKLEAKKRGRVMKSPTPLF